MLFKILHSMIHVDLCNNSIAVSNAVTIEVIIISLLNTESEWMLESIFMLIMLLMYGTALMTMLHVAVHCMNLCTNWIA